VATGVLEAGESLAEAAGALVQAVGRSGGPTRVVIDSKDVREGDLFVGLPGSRLDGGQFAVDALRRGAWGALVGTQWAREIAAIGEDEGRQAPGEGWVFGAPDPLAAMQALALAYRRELACPVVGITGSNGKTTVKDICRALFPEGTHAGVENMNTEIGVPLTILNAHAGSPAMVLEMGMRGSGQIAELCELGEPDVGVVTNVGPVHLELLGSIEAIAATKAEMLSGVIDGGTLVVQASAGLLEPHLVGDLQPSPANGTRIVRFGEGGDVSASDLLAEAGETDATVTAFGDSHRFKFPFLEAHNLDNALAAVGAGIAIGQSLEEMARRAPGIVFSRLRGEMVELPGGALLVNDCYNANPVSMSAALDHLTTLRGDRRIAVLGEMRELGPQSDAMHAEVGARARDAVDLLVGVGEQARAYEPDVFAETAEQAASELEGRIAPGDVILVKGSRAVGLELVADLLSGGVDGER